jgi:hypothetical protein
MMTAAECLAKADELDGIARQCVEADRDVFIERADEWRRNASVAQQQESWIRAWVARNPPE